MPVSIKNRWTGAVIATVTAEEFAMAQAVKIRDAESKCADAENDMNRCKASLKDAKELFDGCVSALRRLCRGVLLGAGAVEVDGDRLGRVAVGVEQVVGGVLEVKTGGWCDGKSLNIHGNPCD